MFDGMMDSKEPFDYEKRSKESAVSTPTEAEPRAVHAPPSNLAVGYFDLPVAPPAATEEIEVSIPVANIGFMSDEYLNATRNNGYVFVAPLPTPPAPTEAPLCEDEGCDHFGTPHVCVTAEPSGATELPELDANHPYYAEAGREWNQRVPKDFAWSPFEVRLIEERMQRERQLRDYKAKYEATLQIVTEHAAHCHALRLKLIELCGKITL